MSDAVHFRGLRSVCGEEDCYFKRKREKVTIFSAKSLPVAFSFASLTVANDPSPSFANLSFG